MLLALLGAGAERHARDRAFRTPLDWARRRLALDADVPPGNWAADLADGLARPCYNSTRARGRRAAVGVDWRREGRRRVIAPGRLVKWRRQRVHARRHDLLAACAAGKLSVVRRLLAHPDIDVNLGDRRGVSPLMQSAASGFDDGVLALLAAGARRDAHVPQGPRGKADYAARARPRRSRRSCWPRIPTRFLFLTSRHGGTSWRWTVY